MKTKTVSVGSRKHGWRSMAGILTAVTVIFCSSAGFATQSDDMIIKVPLPEDLQDAAGPISFWIENGSKRHKLKLIEIADGEATLLVNGRIGVGTYYLYGREKGDKKPELEPLDYCFEILGPSISTAEVASLSPGETITLTGVFFSKNPKVYLCYRTEEGGREIRTKCRIDSAGFAYKALPGQGKELSPMDETTGVSKLKAFVPRLKTADPLDARIVVETDNGDASAPITIKNGGASNARGTLISYNYRDTVNAGNVQSYLFDTFQSGSGMMGWITRAAGWALYKNSKMSDQTYKYDIILYTIVYWTVDGNGTAIPASGVVAIPGGIASAPLLSFQHGTMLTKAEAPSMSNGTEMAFAVTYASTDGFLTSIPDHAGLGAAAYPASSLYHPYCQAVPIAYSDADMIPALRAFLVKAYADGKLKNPVVLDGRIFLGGYSEGGYATLGLQREFEANPGQYNVGAITASAPMDGPYSLSDVMLNRLMSDEAFRVPYFAPYLLVTMNNAYQYYAKASDYMASPYDQTVAPLIDGYHSSDLVNSAMPMVVKNSLLPSIQSQLIAKQGPFYEGLAKNDLIELPSPGWKPAGPVMLVHGKTDDCVMYENSSQALSYFQGVMGKIDISLRTLKSNALIDVLSLASPTHVLYAPYAVGEVWTWFHQAVNDGANASLPPTEEVETEGDTSDLPGI